ncbi:MAG TPA: YwiC-like family protein [Candidatus Acidoferrales bacterium]|nr:YwiC-like family protein [Candidatus Acidoferrales bacterium]
MAGAASRLQTQQPQTNERLKAMLVPREHGAWGLLFIPLMAAACIGKPEDRSLLDLLMLTMATLTLFWLRTPLEAYLGFGLMKARTAEEKRATLQLSLLLMPFAFFTLWILIFAHHHTGLLLIGALVGAAFAVQSVLRMFGRRMRMMAQMVGAIGLTASAAAAYAVVTGKLDARAFAIWFACWLFAGDQIHYVQLRMHTAKVQSNMECIRRARHFLLGQLIMIAAVCAATAWHLLPTLALAAFVPIVLRGVFWLTRRGKTVDVHWLGVTELLHGITFGVLLVSTFLLYR